VPAGADVHTFDPTPSTVVKVGAAKVIVMNGLGLDDWLDKVVTNAGGVQPVKLGSLSDVDLIQGEGGPNPHLWMNVAYAEEYVDEIRAALSAADPGHAADYTRNASGYAQRLTDLDAWVRQQMDAVPAANRRVVTFHDAFPYFARAYGLEVVGVAVDAPGQDPSAAQIAALIGAIRVTGVKAIFAEGQFSPKLVEQLAAETGTKVVSDLFDDSLGNPPVTSYEAVIRWDVSHIVDALK
jgi:ABC-type Zn uptake system ZnuABC Zn-binding protein ZnuA